MTHTTYRKLPDSGVWHYCMNCRDWPTKDFAEISSAVAAPAPLCADCARLESSGRCQRSDEVSP